MSRIRCMAIDLGAITFVLLVFFLTGPVLKVVAALALLGWTVVLIGDWYLFWDEQEERRASHQ